MFRRCVSFLVIVGFCASQLALMPHAHEQLSAEEQRKHDATPHFHFALAGQDHHHGHRHAHSPQHPAKGPVSKQSPQGFAALDHDTDAIYVATQDSLVSTPTQASTTLIGALAADVVGELISSPELDQSFGCYWHPPDDVRDGSGTYLTLRNLRI